MIEKLALVGLLPLLLSALQACSSTSAPAGDAASGTGGLGGDGLGGNASDGSTGDVARDGVLDAAAAGTPFSCGDGALTCATDQTYCRQISGQRLPDGGQYAMTYDCADFKTGCAPHDCNCIVAAPGNVYCFACQQLPSGAVVARCGPV